MKDQAKIVALLVKFQSELIELDDGDETRQALTVTNEFLRILKKGEANSFILASQGGIFTHQITLLRGGFGSKPLKLSTEMIAQFDLIRQLIPSDNPKFNTFFNLWL